MGGVIGRSRLPQVSHKFAFGLFDLDWDVFTQHIEGAINRVPVLEKTGVKSTVCGPGEREPGGGRWGAGPAGSSWVPLLPVASPADLVVGTAVPSLQAGTPRGTQPGCLLPPCEPLSEWAAPGSLAGRTGRLGGCSRWGREYRGAGCLGGCPEEGQPNRTLRGSRPCATRRGSHRSRASPSLRAHTGLFNAQLMAGKLTRSGLWGRLCVL